MSHSHKVFIDDYMKCKTRVVAGPLLRYHQCNTPQPLGSGALRFLMYYLILGTKWIEFSLKTDHSQAKALQYSPANQQKHIIFKTNSTTTRRSP